MFKRCPGCHILKPIEAFKSKSGKTSYFRCLPCYSSYKYRFQRGYRVRSDKASKAPLFERNVEALNRIFKALPATDYLACKVLRIGAFEPIDSGLIFRKRDGKALFTFNIPTILQETRPLAAFTLMELAEYLTGLDCEAIYE